VELVASLAVIADTPGVSIFNPQVKVVSKVIPSAGKNIGKTLQITFILPSKRQKILVWKCEAAAGGSGRL